MKRTILKSSSTSDNSSTLPHANQTKTKLRSTTTGKGGKATTSSKSAAALPSFRYTQDSAIDATKTLLFHDFLGRSGRTLVNLSGYRLNKGIFQSLGSENTVLQHLQLDRVSNFQSAWFQQLRNKTTLRSLSLEAMTFTIEREFLSVIFSMTQLQSLNLKRNSFRLPSSFKDISQLTELKTLNLSHCEGIDDYCLVSLADLITRGRSLETIDLSESKPFGDEALVELTQAGMNILVEIRVNKCNHLSSLALSGLNVKMDRLEALSFHSLTNLTSTVYSWIGQGCRRLKSLNVCHNLSLNDSSLGLIGKCCQQLTHLNVSSCLSLTDAGFQLFFESFLGELRFINLNNCSNFSDITLSLIVVKQSSSLESLHLNSLSRVTDGILAQLFERCLRLNTFEMCCELRPISKSRTSTVPHLSNRSLEKVLAPDLSCFIAAGAIVLSDTGLHSLVSSCRNLVKMNFSFCSKITNFALQSIAECLTKLESLNLTACIYITDKGVHSLCQGRFFLQSLEVNGCAKITDLSLRYLARHFPTSLQMLSVRSCDLITNEGIKQLGKYCGHLHVLDISNLDYVTIDAINYLAEQCIYLKELHCAGCGFTAKELQSSAARLLPFAKPFSGSKPELEPRALSVVHHNLFLLHQRRAHRAANIVVKFMRLIQQFKDVLLRKKEKNRERALVEYYFSMLKAKVSTQLKIRHRKKRVHAAKVIQWAFKRWYSKRRAQRKLRYLKTQYSQAVTIQRVYRGHYARKRMKLMFERQRKVKDFFAMIVGRYYLVVHARALFGVVAKLQNFVRGCLIRGKFVMFNKALALLQIKFKSKHSSARRKYMKLLSLQEIERMKAIARKEAARKILRNWKNRLFNSQMSSFMLYCGLINLSNFQEQTWNSTIIQKRWRGFIVRLRNYRKLLLDDRHQAAAKKLQTWWRSRYHTLLYRRKRLPRYRRVMTRWQRIAKIKSPQLRLGRDVKIVQRAYRLHLFRCNRYHAAVKVLSFYRYQCWKFQMKLRHFEKQVKCVRLIQSYWKAHQVKKAMRLRRARRHMAAFKIFLKVNKLFELQRIQRQKRLEESQARMSILELKRQKIFEKRVEVVKRIKRKYYHMQARKIQRVWHAFKIRRMKLEEERIAKEKKEQGSDEDGSLSLVGFKAKGGRRNLLRPIATVAEGISSIGKLLIGSELIPAADERKFANSVLKYQVKTILQEGVTELQLTLGDHEAKAFQGSQNQLKMAKLPHFVRLENDLSGSLGLDIALWAQFGTGKECICILEIEAKGSHVSNAQMKLRETELAGQYVKLVWHPQIHFEIRGKCSGKLGLADFAIEDLQICDVPEAAEQLLKRGYLLIKDMSKIGFPGVSIWGKTRRAENDELLFKFNRVQSQPWCDDRLLRVMKAFNLTEDDVFRFYRVFENILYGRNRDTLRVEELFAFIDFPYNQISRWVVQAVKPQKRAELTFSEYVHLVSSYIMLSPKDLTRFLFQHADDEKKLFLRRDQFEKLLELLSQGSPFNMKIWETQYEKFHDKKLKFQFIKHFEQFVEKNPGSLWKPQLLQQKLKQANLGVGYWEKKVEQYRVIREQLGIRLI